MQIRSFVKYQNHMKLFDLEKKTLLLAHANSHGERGYLGSPLSITLALPLHFHTCCIEMENTALAHLMSHACIFFYCVSTLYTHPNIIKVLCSWWKLLYLFQTESTGEWEQYNIMEFILKLLPFFSSIWPPLYEWME